MWELGILLNQQFYKAFFLCHCGTHMNLLLYLQVTPGVFPRVEYMAFLMNVCQCLCYKTFFLLLSLLLQTNKLKYLSSTKHFQPSLTFAIKALAYPSGAPHRYFPCRKASRAIFTKLLVHRNLLTGPIS